MTQVETKCNSVKSERLTLAITVAFLCVGRVEAHEWQVAGKTVEAIVVAHDSYSVTLMSRNGRSAQIGIQQLAPADLAYLKDVVLVQQAAVAQNSLALQQQSVNIQAAQYWSQWYQLWVVQFDGPRGPFWRLVPARDSEQATNAAWSEYPNARLLWVQRLNRK